MLLSVFVALSLTPALCALILKPVDGELGTQERGFFGAFNRGFRGYEVIYRTCTPNAGSGMLLITLTPSSILYRRQMTHLLSKNVSPNLGRPGTA